MANLRKEKKFGKQPIFKFRLTGKKSDLIEKELREIEKSYDDIIVKFTKTLEIEDDKKSNIMGKIKDQKLSLEEIGIETLKENLTNLDFKNTFDYGIVFNLLSENRVDSAQNIILKKQTSLKSFGGMDDNKSITD